MVRKIVRQRAVIHFGFDGAGFKQGLDLGSEIKRAVVGERVIERLHTEAIAGDEQFALVLVPDGEGKHAAQMLDATASVFFVEMKNGFGVTVGVVNVAARFKCRTKVGMVVDFTVVRNVEGSIFISHRLMTGSNVNNAETAMTQANSSRARVNEDAGIVRPTMC